MSAIRVVYSLGSVYKVCELADGVGNVYGARGLWNIFESFLKRLFSVKHSDNDVWQKLNL